MEDYDPEVDADLLVPYLKELYADLMLRSSKPGQLDKITFLEYTGLPGIINDRLHTIFAQEKLDHVTEESFVKNFTHIFIGDLE